MDKNQRKILNWLYDNPTEINSTKKIISESTGLDIDEFEKAIIYLEKNNYVEDNTQPNQDKGYKITVVGAIKIHKRSFKNVIKWGGGIVSIILIIIGIIGLVFQFYFGRIGQKQMDQQYQLQEQQYKLQQEQQ
mgnify:CR=1 FL=1|jgi:hypothetical protein